MLCMARVRMDSDPNAIKCYAFGAPPVLSLSEKTAARNVMSVKCCPLCSVPTAECMSRSSSAHITSACGQVLNSVLDVLLCCVTCCQLQPPLWVPASSLSKLSTLRKVFLPLCTWLSCALLKQDCMCAWSFLCIVEAGLYGLTV